MAAIGCPGLAGARHGAYSTAARYPVPVLPGTQRKPYAQPEDQRPDRRGRRRAGHPAAVGAARPPRDGWHQVRLRHRPVRRLHGPRRRPGDPLLPAPARGGAGQRDHDRRGSVGQGRRGGADRLAAARGGPVRLLPVGPDDGRRGAARRQPEPVGRRHQRPAHEHLPLLHLPPHPGRRAPRGRAGEGLTMLPIERLAGPERSPATTSRRRFLVGAAVAGAGLTVGFGLPHVAAAAEGQGAAATNVVTPFEGYIRIAPDNTVTVLAAHLEMGQGPYTGIATLVAEELDADWSQMRAQGAWGNPKLYGNLAWGGNVQGTGGSTAMASSFLRYRKAGALARAMLVAAATEAWHVPAAEIRVEKGVLSHPSGKRATMGELADAAARIGEETLAAMQPADDIPLKDPGDFALIGNPDLHRLDSVAKTTGAPVFTIDVRLPGMLTAVVAHPPRFGAKVKSFNAGGAKAVKGVVEVVEIPRGVAVVAETTWAAIKGRDALTVEWDDSATERRGSEQILAEYKALLDKPEAAVARSDGDPQAALAAGGRPPEAGVEVSHPAPAAPQPV